MALFKDLLKKWFYTQGTQAASATARVPLLNASGEPIGCDTMANLASVLGADKVKVKLLTEDSSITALSSLENSIFYYIGSIAVARAMTDWPSGLSMDNEYLLFKYTSGNYGLQILFSSENSIYIRRYDNKWRAWKCIPNFYQNYADLNALTNALVAQNALSIGNVMVVTNADSYTRFWPADRALESGIANIAVGAGIIENGRTLIVAKDTTTKKWAESNVAGSNSYLGREAAIADFNGRANTNKILETLGDNAPAATYCHTYHPANVDSADTNMGAGRWWLPSLGELAMIWAHVREINFVLSAIGGTQIPVGIGGMWSSTESSANNAWYLNFNYGYFYYDHKSNNSFRVRPVSAFY